jgi:hypothetical protein
LEALMSYRRNDESESASSFDTGEYSTNRRHRGKSKRRGSAKVKGACRGGDGKFISCSERGARPNAGARANTREDDIADRRRSKKSKSARKASKKSSWGGCKGGYSKSYSTKSGRKSRKSKGSYSKYAPKRDRVRPGSKGRATEHGHLTRKGSRDFHSADKDIQKATTILRGAKNKVTGIPRDSLSEILKLLKYALDT